MPKNTLEQKLHLGRNQATVDKDSILQSVAVNQETGVVSFGLSTSVNNTCVSYSVVYKGGSYDSNLSHRDLNSFVSESPTDKSYEIKNRQDTDRANCRVIEATLRPGVDAIRIDIGGKTYIINREEILELKRLEAERAGGISPSAKDSAAATTPASPSSSLPGGLVTIPSTPAPGSSPSRLPSGTLTAPASGSAPSRLPSGTLTAPSSGSSPSSLPSGTLTAPASGSAPSRLPSGTLTAPASGSAPSSLPSGTLTAPSSGSSPSSLPSGTLTAPASSSSPSSLPSGTLTAPASGNAPSRLPSGTLTAPASGSAPSSLPSGTLTAPSSGSSPSSLPSGSVTAPASHHYTQRYIQQINELYTQVHDSKSKSIDDVIGTVQALSSEERGKIDDIYKAIERNENGRSFMEDLIRTRSRITPDQIEKLVKLTTEYHSIASTLAKDLYLELDSTFDANNETLLKMIVDHPRSGIEAAKLFSETYGHKYYEGEEKSSLVDALKAELSAPQYAAVAHLVEEPSRWSAGAYAEQLCDCFSFRNNYELFVSMISALKDEDQKLQGVYEQFNTYSGSSLNDFVNDSRFTQSQLDKMAEVGVGTRPLAPMGEL